jgi:hypothetical protein
MTDTTTTPAAPFRWRLEHRPDVRFGHAAGGAAGLLVAAAFLALVVATASGDDARLPGVGFHLALIAIALLAGWKVRGPVRSAAVAAVAVAVPLLWVFAVIGDAEGGSRGDFRVILLLSVATYGALYLLTWTRGRAVLLGLTLLFAANWLVFEVASQDVPFAVDVAGQAQDGGIEGPGTLVARGDRTTETGIAALGVAVVLLGAGILLDRRGRAGAATPCLLVGGIYSVYAAVTLGADVDDAYVLGSFVLIAGLAIGLAGSLGRRRGTSWIGALVALAGALTVIAKGTTETASGGDDAAWGFAGYALLGAAILLVAGVVIARALDEPVDGGEPAPVAAAPPAPTSEPDPVGTGAAAASTEARDATARGSGAPPPSTEGSTETT